MRKKIAQILKMSRKNKGYTTEQVANELRKRGLEISGNTLYNYENMHSQPSADMFVALCKIYGIKSLDIFFDEAETSKLVNPTFGKYNNLNASGKQKADEYITDLSEQKKYTAADAEPEKLVKDIIDSVAKDSIHTNR